MTRRSLWLVLLLVPGIASAATDKYVAVGASNTACTLANPGSLLAAMQTTGCTGGINPGDTIWIRGGTYTLTGTQQFVFRSVTGAATGGPNNGPNYLTYRNYNNEHVRIDMNVNLTQAAGVTWRKRVWGDAGTNNIYIRTWGLEFFNSSTETRSTNVVAVAPATMNEQYMLSTGGQFINNIIRDGINLLIESGTGSHGKKLAYGNYFQYSGYTGTDRGHGHSVYFHNNDTDGEDGRSTVDRNIAVRCLSQGMHMYTEGGIIAYQTVQHSVELADGHDPYPTDAWTQYGVDRNWIIGRTSGGDQECHHALANTLWHAIIDDNTDLGGSGGPTIGEARGACDVQVTNNLWAHPNLGMAFSSPHVVGSGTGGGTWGPVVVTGNTFYGPLSGGDCWNHDASCMPLFNATNYCGAGALYGVNTCFSALPTSGADILREYDNAFEQGRGQAYLFNPDSSATVTLHPSSMGCYAGEHINIYNAQNFTPWDKTNALPLNGGSVDQTGCADVSVSTTADTGIYQPGFTGVDGVTPFPKPGDAGPYYAVYIMVPDWTFAVATPTPTASNTPTRTSSPTPTLTSTRTFTPSLTPTATKTFTPSLTPSQSPTAAATSTFTPTATRTFTASRTPTVTPTPNTFTAGFIDLQNCVRVAPFVTADDATVFGGKYLYSTVGDLVDPVDGASGTVTCTFTTVAGQHWIWFRLNTPAASADSMFVSIDGETVANASGANQHIFDMGERRDCVTNELEKVWNLGWVWSLLADRSTNCAGLTNPTGYARSSTPGSDAGITLTAGTHTITVTNREVASGSSALIDAIWITRDPGFLPTDVLLTPTPTPVPFGTGGICKYKCNHHTCYARSSQPCTVLPVPCPCN